MGRRSGAERGVGAAGAAAGGLGAGFAACHAVCQSLISALAVLGIALLGMPLALLEPWSAPLLLLAAVLLGYSAWLCRARGLPLKSLARPVGTGLVISIAIILVLFGLNVQVSAAPEANDPCAPPDGYTEESWREHTSHHPERWAECLKR